jgi:hypothetical protein
MLGTFSCCGHYYRNGVLLTGVNDKKESLEKIREEFSE